MRTALIVRSRCAAHSQFARGFLVQRAGGDTKMIDATVHYELRFSSLFDSGRGYAFPCDPQGQVDLDGLSERGRANYLRAQALVGRELSVPAMRPATLE